MEFQDEIHLKTIADALWERKGSGRAAVLIGAGFSRNAEPNGIHAGLFPLWGEVASAIVSRLYADPKSTSYEQAQVQAKSTSGALRLGDEFVAAHGRSKLDDLLLQTIRDYDFRPGDIHRRMMELPWRDVFTTNYDTLLERAANDVFSRSYDVVANSLEIPTARGPRIVKLHGSMPSQRPFIFTEEDFRTYPRRFATFVNLTQQSMMENVFCLIGFSGDDPNFLAWSGWVRDELGDRAPRIYLCNVLDLNDAKRRMLHDRNVTPIDLAQKFKPQGRANTATRYREAMEYFLSFMEQQKRPNPSRWPSNVPGIPAQNEDKSRNDNTGHATHEADNVARLPQYHPNAKDTYPGWLVAPSKVRKSFTTFPAQWRDQFAQQLLALPTLERLGKFDHFVWTLEICLEPLWNSLATKVKSVLDDTTISPLENSASSQETSDVPKTELNAEQLTQWLQLALSYLRFLREERKASEFDSWANRLEQIATAPVFAKDRLQYEKALYALDEADDERLAELLSKWIPLSHDPVWIMRKAYLFIEIGNLTESRALLTSALLQLRRASKGNRDIGSMSREGWCMKTLALLDDANHCFGGDDFEQRNDRWEELNEFRCNPWSEWSEFVDQLERPAPETRSREVKVGFHPGAFSETLRFGTQDYESALPAYQFCRLVDEVGIPTRASYFESSVKLLAKAAEWFLSRDIVRLPAVLLRTCDQKLLERYFSRINIAKMEEQELSEWLRCCRRILVTAPQRLHRSEKPHSDPIGLRAYHQLTFSVKVLNRISLRLPADERKGIYEDALSLWNSLKGNQLNALHSDVSNLIVDLAYRLEGDSRRVAYLNLVTQPIEGVHNRGNPSHVFNEITLRLTPEASLVKSNQDEQQIRLFVGTLLSFWKADGEGSMTTNQIIHRLEWFFRSELLTASEEREMGKLLWRNTNSDKLIPAVFENTPWQCVRFPEPSKGFAINRLKAFITGFKIPTIREGIQLGDHKVATIWSVSAKFPGDKDEKGDSLIRWNRTESRRIHNNIMEWWQCEDQAKFEERAIPFGSQVLDARINNILLISQWVIIPSSAAGSVIATQIRDFITKAADMEFRTEFVLPALLHLFPDRLDETVQKLKLGLLSLDEQKITSALRGVLFWLGEAGNAKKRRSFFNLPNAPADLLEYLSLIAMLRRRPGLAAALQGIEIALRDLPESLSSVFLSQTSISLEHLLSETSAKEISGLLPFTPEEIPTYRLFAARVAFQLHKRSAAHHEVTSRWMDAINTDVDPVIRAVAREA